jgi:hypothetical protein
LTVEPKRLHGQLFSAGIQIEVELRR